MSTASRSDACPTSSGPFTCSKSRGHAGECSSRQRGVPWVGPAATMQAVLAAHAVARRHAREHASLLRELRVARAKVADLEASRVLEAGMSSARPTEEAPRD
jgi:hypothetical protein